MLTDLESLDLAVEDARAEALRAAIGILIEFAREMEYVAEGEDAGGGVEYSWIADKATYVLGEVEKELTIP